MYSLDALVILIYGQLLILMGPAVAVGVWLRRKWKQEDAHRRTRGAREKEVEPFSEAA
jgi:hypothetical protein